jgi:hypothetical protein
MPKKQKRTEAEIHAMIVQDVKIRLGCADFAPDFTLHAVHDQRALHLSFCTTITSVAAPTPSFATRQTSSAPSPSDLTAR